MIRLHSLGECTIEVGRGQVRPDSEVVFAALLYLLVARGRRVDRSALAELLWPESGDLNARHCVRQTVYKLKQLGVPLVSDPSGIEVPASAVELDYELLGEPAASDPAALASVRGTFLPGYAPRLSAGFGEWLEQQREHVHARVRRTLVAALATARSGARWDTVEELARQCLAFDPLNEEATLALAEATAMAGGKAQALRILDRYVHELGPGADGIHLPATVLRRRVAESLPDAGVLASLDGPFVGRADNLAHLAGLFKRASRGSGGACLITGEAGIGKSRLCDEFARLAQLQGGVVVHLRCHQLDGGRPLGVLADLVQQLLGQRGALGCDPGSLAILRRLTSHDDPPLTLSEPAEPILTLQRLGGALCDLLDAVSEERSLALIIDDADRMDGRSRRALEELSAWVETRRILLLFASREAPRGGAAAGPPLVPVPEHRLAPLSEGDAGDLFGALIAQPATPAVASARRWCASVSGGNPLFVHELAAHWAATGQSGVVPASLSALVGQRLAALSPRARRVLQACAILGKHATLGRLQKVLEMRRIELVDSLGDLESRGFLLSDDAALRIKHDLIAAEALKSLTAGARRLLHHAVAAVLSRELRASRPSLILWDCMYHWQSAGETARAQKLASSCAAHAIELGLPADAIPLLELSLLSPGSVEMKVRIYEMLAYATRVAFQWSSYVQVAEDLSILRAQLGEFTPRHDDEEISLIEARWRVGQNVVGLLADATRCVTDCTAADSHRSRAAMLALILADSVVDADAARRIYLAAPRSEKADPGSAADQLLIEIVFHAAYGDLDRGVAAARSLIERESTQPLRASGIRRMRMCAVPLRRAGFASEARQILVASMSAAVQQRLAAHATAVADLLASIELDCCNLQAARHWYELAQRWSDRGGASDVHRDVTELGIRIALHEGRITDARRLFVGAPYEPFTGAATRHRALIQALMISVEMAEGQLPNSRAVAELQEAHIAMRPHGGHDVIALALFEALVRTGSWELAAKLCEEYFSVHRRERWTVVPFPHARRSYSLVAAANARPPRGAGA